VESFVQQRAAQNQLKATHLSYHARKEQTSWLTKIDSSPPDLLLPVHPASKANHIPIPGNNFALCH
jgi:hypothetical protein